MALPADLGEGGEGGGVVPLLGAGILVGQGSFQVLSGPGPAHHAGHRRTGEGVVQALEGSERHPGGGILAEQVAAAEGFHHRDAHAQALAGLVEGLPLGVHVEKVLLIGLLRPEGVAVLAGGLEVVAGVDAEHDDVHVPALRRRQGHLRVVAGEADAPDDALFFQLQGIVHDAAGADGLPVGHSVHIVDHADIDIVCTQAAEEVGIAGSDLLQVPGALVLPVLPGGADVALDDKLLPPARQSPAQLVPDLGVRDIAVQAVSPGGLHDVQKLLDLGIALSGVALTAHADLAHLDAGAAQCAVLHRVFPP